MFEVQRNEITSEKKFWINMIQFNSSPKITSIINFKLNKDGNMNFLKMCCHSELE